MCQTIRLFGYAFYRTTTTHQPLVTQDERKPSNSSHASITGHR